MLSIWMEDLGYDEFFASGRRASGFDKYAIARVAAEHKGAYRIRTQDCELHAEITGKQMYDAVSREDYPAVGDWVAVTVLDAERAVIHGFLPRKTILKRKYSGKYASQVIAANIDVAFVIESVDRDYNLNRFERYLTLVKEGKIEPVLVLNKIDLISHSDLTSRKMQIEGRFGHFDLVTASAVLPGGVDDVAKRIERGKTYCLLGSSGVGKSSLINVLLEEADARVDFISSHSGKGKHTTTGREMYFLPRGGILVDNPGMREVGLTDSHTGIDGVFDEIAALAAVCRFNDCTHMQEPGCAVRAAVESGELEEERLSHFLRLRREAEHYEMTDLEKRRKDREFGKFVKRYKKEQKKRGG